MQLGFLSHGLITSRMHFALLQEGYPACGGKAPDLPWLLDGQPRRWGWGAWPDQAGIHNGGFGGAF